MKPLAGLLACLVLASCVASPPPTPEQSERIARAQKDLEEDPTVQARVDAVQAAKAQEARPMLVDEVQVRIGDNYLDDDHQLRVIARVPLNRPAEVRAEKEVLRAETKMAVSRLEETSLERRAELCFPAIEALAAQARRQIYTRYAERQTALLEWNTDWRSSGMVNELSGARFELESRIKLASWEPAPAELGKLGAFTLPRIATANGMLARTPQLVRETVRHHHPSVALRRATAERYRALAERARARSQPWIKFVDLRYEYQSDGRESGVGGQLAFEIPLGGQLANAGRYDWLLRESHSEAAGLVEQQIAGSLQALAEVNEFEARTERWQRLLRLADEAEEISDRWWRERLAKPAQVAALLDEAFAARSAVLEARERAGSAYCTVLAMTGVSVEDWPRE